MTGNGGEKSVRMKKYEEEEKKGLNNE